MKYIYILEMIYSALMMAIFFCCGGDTDLSSFWTPKICISRDATTMEDASNYGTHYTYRSRADKAMWLGKMCFKQTWSGFLA